MPETSYPLMFHPIDVLTTRSQNTVPTGHEEKSPRMRRLAMTLMLFLSLLLPVAACGHAESPQQTCESPKSSLSLVVTATMNSLPSAAGDVPCLARKTIEERKPVTLIREDGAPAVVQAARVYPVNEGAKDNDVNKALNALYPAIAGMKAQADGDNVMAALDLVARTSSPGSTIVFLGSGLADRGALNLTKPSLATASPAEVVEQLKQLKSIPDLAGRVVHWYGMGDARGSQKPLIPAQRNNYQAIYAAVFAAAGAEVHFHAGPTGTSKNNPGNGFTLIPVQPLEQQSVDFPTDGSISFDDASALGFEPDSTDFRDPEAARGEISKIAQWLISHPTGNITVLGTTSSAGDEAGRLELSTKRAETICQAAVVEGADASRLRCQGVGIHFDGYTNDRLPSGELDETAAAGNRNVILTFTS